MKDLAIADLFCGAGGTSAGAVEAISALGFVPKLTAINHWDVAIATHTANHPDARHLCTSLDNVNPRHLFGDGELDLLWASPECTHHSQARGGKPISDQSRATAWCVTRWAEACRPPVVLVENVPEFETWGPLYAELKKPERRLRKWDERKADGSSVANPGRMGPLTMEGRRFGLSQILAIQAECNAQRGPLPEIDLINAEEEARIHELIDANTWPYRWTGDEMRADTPTDEIRRDGSIQRVMLDLISQ